MITGLLIVRNGIDCGYTFVETLQTLAAICDDVVICEGNSTDNTIDYLEQWRPPNCTIYRDDWNLKSSTGTEFARITNLGVSRCKGDQILYLQADELLHEKDFEIVRSLLNDNVYRSLQFNFVHLRYDIRWKIQNDAYTHAIRAFRNNGNVHSITDGYSFDGEIQPCHDTGIVVYHAGYVFPHNILRKMINHQAYFYRTDEPYCQRATTAKKLLSNLDNLTVEEIHQALEPFYQLGPHGLSLPKLLVPHVGKLSYLPPRR